jgi:hypothetical protein
MSDVIKYEALVALDPNLRGNIGVKNGVVTLSDDSLTLPSDSDINDKIAELNVSIPLDELRAERNVRLAETDYLALSDNTLTDAMLTYRQALRDITDNATSLDDVTWPTKP